MITYIVRRVLYAIPILIGVNVITFVLFFVVNPPELMARRHLGERYVSDEDVQRWLHVHNYDLPLFLNTKAKGIEKITRTIFYQKSINLFFFRFGRSDRNNIDIGGEIRRRMWPSLAIAVPSFLISLAITTSVALFIAFYRGTYLDLTTVVVCTVLMSISQLYYIIVGQYLFARVLRLVPVSGYHTGLFGLKFLVLPVIIGVIGGIGGGVRFNRTIFLEEIGRDYVHTARAKGLSESGVLFRHVLKNALIPILTSVVMQIPFLFMGSLLLESFFAIPGLGSFTIDAIHSQDFAIVRSMVYLGSVLYIIGLVLVDISYTLVDPRVRLGE